MRGGWLWEVWQAIRKSPLSLTGLALILALVATAVLAPHLAPYDPLETKPRERLKPPSPTHPLGTDQLGRDILSRVLYGAQISLRIAGLVALIAGVSGSVIGLVCGYFGGLLDEVLMRITDVFMAFPQLVLAMAISSALGPSLENAIIAISLTEWTVFARLARSRALAIREETYVEAARAVGAGKLRILFRHILPLSLSPLVVQVSLEMGGIIRTAASLGFLGLGAQPPTPEWGVMVTAGRNYLP
ncbi:MAG: ABC transporter permease, partial [Candidatus Bathyarchaeia archaeon]